MFKVMIADDEHIVREGLINLIEWEQIGCQLVYAAQNGRDLLDNIDKYSPDIIITDIKMPCGNGIDIAKFIYENHHDIKVILLTAYADFSYAKLAIQYNVVDYVTKTGALDDIIHAIEKSKKLIQNERSNKNEAAKISFFKSIIDSSLFDTGVIVQKAQKMDVSLDHAHVLVLRYHEKDPDLNDTSHSRLMDFLATAFQQFTAHIIPLTKNSICMILSRHNSMGDASIRTMCEKIVVTVRALLDIRVSVGISGPVSHIIQLNQAYHQATDALEAGFIEEEQTVFLHSQCKKNSHTSYHKEGDGIIEQIYLYMQKGSPKKALYELRHLFECQRKHKLSESIIKSTGFILKNHCEKMLCPHDVVLSDIYDFKGNIYKLILDTLHFGDYRRIIERMVFETANFIKNSHSKNIITNALNYIEAHYCSNLTLNELAGSIGVNNSYLSRIFKLYTGYTIINYINSKKIEKAKTYLCDTDMKMYEIADAVGINDVTYFSQIFKKYAGVSPKAYKHKKHH